MVLLNSSAAKLRSVDTTESCLKEEAILSLGGLFIGVNSLVEITAFIRGGIDCGFNRTAQARLDALQYTTSRVWQGFFGDRSPRYLLTTDKGPRTNHSF